MSLRLLERTEVAVAVGILLCLFAVAPGNASMPNLASHAEYEDLTNTVFLWRVNRAGRVAEFHNVAGFIQAGSGAQFEVIDGLPAPWHALLAVTPYSGSTEVQFVLTMYADRGLVWEDIVTAGGGEWLHAHVYIPESSPVTPNKFRLTIEEEFNEWSWIADTYSSDIVEPGWNTIKFPLSEEMRHLRYFRATRYLYLTFSHVDEAGSPVVLDGPFYIDGLGLNGTYNPFT